MTVVVTHKKVLIASTTSHHNIFSKHLHLPMLSSTLTASVDTNLAMSIAPSGVVVVGGTDATVSSAATKLKVNGDIEFAAGGSFIITGLAFLTTSDDPSVNIIRNISDGGAKRPLTFSHKVGEACRFRIRSFRRTWTSRYRYRISRL
jgi:hypothetical protein